MQSTDSDGSLEVNPPTAVGGGDAMVAPGWSVSDFVQAHQALGTPLGEAIVLAAAIHGEAATVNLLGAALDDLAASSSKLDLLDEVACAMPTLANAALKWVAVCI